MGKKGEDKMHTLDIDKIDYQFFTLMWMYHEK